MTCKVCGQTEEWHQEHKPMHEYSGDVGQIVVPEPKQPGKPPMQRGDLVLRMALLKKGLITEVELGEAELWVEQAQLRNQALTVEPDPAGGGWRFRLVDFDAWIAEQLAASSQEKKT
jgi:hypothetical protein